MTLAYKIIAAALGVIIVLGSAAIVGALVHNHAADFTITAADK